MADRPVRQLSVKEVIGAVGVDAIAETLSPEQWGALLEHRQGRQGGKEQRKTKPPGKDGNR
jgi:hypothetical protein